MKAQSNSLYIIFTLFTELIYRPSDRPIRKVAENRILDGQNDPAAPRDNWIEII